MEELYKKEFQVGWGDLDSNAHMKNTAYLDHSATTRFSYFNANGFSAARFHELQFGPIVFKDEVHFQKELRLLEKFTVSFLLDGMSPDGSLFRIANEILNEKGERSALVLTHGAWFDLRKRKIIPPPQELIDVMKRLKKTPTYLEIERQK
ncbi:MAG: thioesterase family protein [bacterium]